MASFKFGGFVQNQRQIPAFCASSVLPCSLQTHRPSPLYTSVRGQFAKRLRPARILDGNRELALPDQNDETDKAIIETRVTPPKASLITSLSSIASTGAGIFILGFIVFIHESGHFLAARLQGIRVKTFSIGFGPTLWRVLPRNSETEFTVRLLPLGGYVSFPEHVTVDEESGAETIDEDPNLLQNRPVFDRALVISAGVIANIILAWTAIFSSVSALGLPTYTVHPGAVIASVVDKEGPAAQAGIQSNDVILSLNGTAVSASFESAGKVAEKIRGSNGTPLDLVVQRGVDSINITVRPRCCLPDGSSSVGVQLVPNATVFRSRPQSVLQTVSMTNSEFARLFRQTWRGLSSLISNFRTTSQNLSGPIGVVSMGADLARNDTAALLTFCAVISINLALINSLPLPALDGGQMTFLIIEALRGAPVSLKVQDAVNRTALVILLAFSGVLFFGDLERLNVVGALQKLFG